MILAQLRAMTPSPPDGLLRAVRAEAAAALDIDAAEVAVDWIRVEQRVPERAVDIELHITRPVAPDRVVDALDGLRLVVGAALGVGPDFIHAVATPTSAPVVLERGQTRKSHAVRPVAWVHTDRDVPRDDEWGDHTSVIELDTSMPDEALDGIEAFSHLEVVFVFDRLPSAKIVPGARHPRNNPDWPRVGILAQRGKARPNRLGVSRCRLVRRTGRRLEVCELDAIDGTPVIDIKPWMDEFGPHGEVRQPEWSHALMAKYFE